MLRNNADVRRCSYFELGLPVAKEVYCYFYLVVVVVVSPSQLSSFPFLSYCACAAARFASVFVVH